MRRFTTAGAIVVSALLVLGCTSTPGSSVTAAPRVPSLANQPMAACTISGEIPVTASVQGYCGTLLVPEDRTQPSGRTVGLHVGVVPAAAAQPKPDPFFAIAGGPGLGCGPSVIAAFIDAGSASNLDVSCIAGPAPTPTFHLP